MNAMFCKRYGLGKISKHYGVDHGSVPCRPLFYKTYALYCTVLHLYVLIFHCTNCSFQTAPLPSNLYRKVQYNRIHFSVAKCSLEHYSALYCSAIQCSTMQCSTLNSAAQCSVRCCCSQWPRTGASLDLPLTSSRHTQCSAVLCVTIQCSAVQKNSAPCSVEQYRAVGCKTK